MRQLNRDLNNILFLDIETVPEFGSFEQLSARMQQQWVKKLNNSRKARSVSEKLTYDDLASNYFEKAAIFAEFGKIVCISAGFLKCIGSTISDFRIKSFYGNDECQILQNFSKVLRTHFYDLEKHSICGHNLKEFDIPYICRRLIINKLALPPIINIGGLKPWQTPHLIDTLDHWKFGDYKNYTSLDLLTSIMGIESPKDDLDGSLVAKAYYEDNDLRSIVKYCEKDVVSVAQLYLRFRNMDLINPQLVNSKTQFTSEEE